MRQLFTLAALAALTAFETSGTVSGQASASWLQWGGPGRNFVSESKDLASSWPSDGPKKLWSRPLGEGHSSILVESGRLYTMYRQVARAGQGPSRHDEVVAAFDAATGKTLWEVKYPAPTDRIDFSEGLGPHSTPAIGGNLIFAVSSRSEYWPPARSSHPFLTRAKRSLSGTTSASRSTPWYR